MASLADKLRAKEKALLEYSAGAPALHAASPAKTSLAVRHLQNSRACILSESQRVVGLPVVDYSQENATAWTRRLARLPPEKMVFPNGDAVTLRDIQAQMLRAFEHAQGGFFCVGTGWGKAWAALLLGAVMPDVTRVIILAPASTLINLDRERARLGPYFRMCPDMVIESFENMQRATAEGEEDLIAQLVQERRGDPSKTVLVFDEAHRLKNLESARGRRVMRIVQRFPELRVCVLSGSMTDNSLFDFAHLAWMALREKCPMPAEWAKEDFARRDARRALFAWAAVLDVDGEPGPGDWAEIGLLAISEGLEKEFLSTRGAQRVAVARLAFQRRLRKTAGVVVSSDSSLQGVALVLRGFQSALPDEIAKAMDTVTNEGIDPDGNELADEVSIWRLQRQLAQGFFYVWDWPTGPDGKRVVDNEWKVARSNWNKQVRRELKDHSRTGYDSPQLIYTSVYRDLVLMCDGHPTLQAWVVMDELVQAAIGPQRLASATAAG